jgi:hypothetical protein
MCLQANSHLSRILGHFQVLFIPILLCHEPLAIGEPYIKMTLLLLQVIRFEIAICDKASHEERSDKFVVR